MSCFEEIPFWNELYLKYGDEIQMKAIAWGQSEEMINHFSKSYGIDIPIYFDDLGVVKGGDTPLKILVNKRGKIINKQGTTRSNRKLQNEFEALVVQNL